MTTLYGCGENSKNTFAFLPGLEDCTAMIPIKTPRTIKPGQAVPASSNTGRCGLCFGGKSGMKPIYINTRNPSP